MYIFYNIISLKETRVNTSLLIFFTWTQVLLTPTNVGKEILMKYCILVIQAHKIKGLYNIIPYKRSHVWIQTGNKSLFRSTLISVYTISCPLEEETFRYCESFPHSQTLLHCVQISLLVIFKWKVWHFHCLHRYF